MRRGVVKACPPHAGVKVDGRVEPPYTTAVVYYAYDNRGDLLYVGTSTNLISRLAGHVTSSAWWSHVRRVDWIDFDSAAAARAYEALEIAALNPPFNIAGRSI